MFKAFDMTSLDITEAMAYAAEEPYGATREDLRAGMQLAMFYATNKRKDDPAQNWYDFFPNADMPAEAREALFKRLAAQAKARAREEARSKSKELVAQRAISLIKAFNARWIGVKGKKGAK